MKKRYVLLSALILNALLTSCGQSTPILSPDDINVPDTSVHGISVSNTNIVEEQESNIASSPAVSTSADNAEEPEIKEVLITVPDNVVEIIITPRENPDMTFKYTDATKIDAVVAYISDFGTLQTIHLGKYEPSPSTATTPPDYEITLCTLEGNTEVYYLSGANCFKQGKESPWGDIDYATRVVFRDIIQANEPDIPAKIPLFWDVPITVPENVTAVVVEESGCAYAGTHRYTEPEKINAIVSYITDLGVLKNSEIQNVRIDGGKYYKITLYSKDGTSEVYTIMSHFFKQGENGLWWCDMKFEDVDRFDELLHKYESDVPEEVPKEE